MAHLDFNDFCSWLQDLDLDVYVKDEKATYLYYTDGKRIGYAEFSPRSGWTISTVHRPCQKFGTGFQVVRHEPDPTINDVNYGLKTAPYGYGRADVTPYGSIEAFLARDKWNAGFKKLERCQG